LKDLGCAVKRASTVLLGRTPALRPRTTGNGELSSSHDDLGMVLVVTVLPEGRILAHSDGINRRLVRSTVWIKAFSSGANAGEDQKKFSSADSIYLAVAKSGEVKKR
jgi:hypothetical protein